MKNLSLLTIIATLVLSITTTSTYAACDFKSKFKCPLTATQKSMLSQNAKLYAELNMTDAQKTKANQIFDKKAKELETINKQIKEKKALLKQLSNQQTQKAAIQKEINTLIAKKQAVNAKYNKQFESGLTTKQKQQLQLIQSTYQIFKAQ